MLTLVIIAVGATCGAALRYSVSVWAAQRFGIMFPYGTLLVNVCGSFLLGTFLTLAAARPWVSSDLRLLVSTGFCGSLTTFSTFGYETVQLFQQGHYLTGVLYALGSVLLGLGAVALGMALVRVAT